MPKPESTEAYISGFPDGTQALLRQMRSIIRSHAPDAQELISYAMPAFRLGRILVYYAGYSGHIGFYPSGTAIAAFTDRLRPYKFSKGAIQFPLDQPLPEKLIADIVLYRVEENSRA